MIIESKKIESKFSVGEKVYYKRNNTIRHTTIKKIVVETSVTKNGIINSIYYLAMAVNNYTHGYYCNRVSCRFKEHQIFSSKDAMKKDMIPTEKGKILKKIKQIKTNINKNKKSIIKDKKKLDAIKKEELIEKLSGI